LTSGDLVDSLGGAGIAAVGLFDFETGAAGEVVERDLPLAAAYLPDIDLVGLGVLAFVAAVVVVAVAQSA